MPNTPRADDPSGGSGSEPGDTSIPPVDPARLVDNIVGENQHETGTADTDVPFEQSMLMAEELKRHAVAHQLISVDEAEHGLAGGDAELIDDAYTRAFAFLTQQLER